MNKLSILSTVRLMLLTGLLSLFFACSTTSTGDGRASLQEFKQKEEDSTTSKGAEDYWAIPEQYKNVPIKQIKSQIEITDYITMKGAATTAATEEDQDNPDAPYRRRPGSSMGGREESPKNKTDREALASYTNKLISLEGVIALTGGQKTSPLEITEPEPGKYEIWVCADKNQKRRPCRYRILLLYEGPKGKGDTLFTRDNVIQFWGVILTEQKYRLKLNEGYSYKRYPKVRVLDLEVIK
jgi:hypothetical protein